MAGRRPVRGGFVELAQALAERIQREPAPEARLQYAFQLCLSRPPHHIEAFTMWFAGGGVRPGIILGETDELGFGPANREDRVHVHDLHATILHLLGVDHLRLTHRFQGRDFRLTDVQGEVVTRLFG